MLTLTTAPTLSPVTTAEAKQHARIFSGFTTDDSYVAELVAAASFKFEDESGYLLRQATYTWEPASGLGVEMKLPVRPYIADSLAIEDDGNALVVDTDYTVAVDTKGVVTVTFTVTPTEPSFEFDAGYEAAADVPALAKLAIKTLVAHWYNNREAFAEKTLGPVAATWESVVRNFRMA